MAGGRADEAPADRERCRWPVGALPRLGILAVGERDEEAAAELVGAYPRGGAEIAGGTIGWAAVESQPRASETQRKHEVRC